MDDYVKILKDHGLKITPQRLAILKYLDENRTHPNADQIYSALKATNPSLSRTTVYNTLDMLKNKNIIEVLTISKTESRYDFNSVPHHHFLCKHCGQIIDVLVTCPYTERMTDGDHRIEEVHGYFKGICKACLAAES